MGIIFPQEIEIKPNKLTKYYQSKGYTTLGPNTLIKINVEDLSEKSNVKIMCKCDFCHKEFLKVRRTIKSFDAVVACLKCSHRKAKPTILQKYGVEPVFKSEKVKNKIKQTFLNKYGVDNPNKSLIVREKTKITNLSRYQNTCSMNGINRVKTNQIIFNKYGVKHFSQTQEYKEKYIQMSIKRYGKENPMQNDIVKAKSMKNKKTKNRTHSKQQKYLNNLLNGEINKYILGYYADIFLEKHNIIIEYDGSGHWFPVKHYLMTKEEFDLLEIDRENKLINNGYKIIRIISRKDRLPKDETILIFVDKMIDILQNKNVNLIRLDIDNQTLNYLHSIQNVDLGVVQKMK